VSDPFFQKYITTSGFPVNFNIEHSVSKKNRSESKNTESESREADLQIARKIQAAMIPRSFPSVEGVDLDSVYLPCGAVGGDLYDIIQISNDTLAFLIFDVTGFGVSSALISAMAKVCFTNHIRAGVSPRAVIERVNYEMIRDISADFYLTAFLGYLDFHDNKLTYCNAGHAYPLIYRKAEQITVPLRTQGTFIGVFENGFFEEQNIYINTGDSLILITDGLYRIFSDNLHEGRLLFEQSVREILSKGPPAQFLQMIKEQFTRIKSEDRIEDDVTAIVAEILTQSRKNQIKDKLGFHTEDPVYLQFLNYYEEIDRAIAVILSSMDAFGYPDDSIRKMKVALTELIVNAILHGNKRDFSKKVTIGHVIDRHHATIAIMDEGDGFDPAIIPDPTLPENLGKDCGRGLFIARHYVDTIEFNSKGNRVVVQKNHTLGAKEA
jgi:sigma-B regulation protein RsbU (phosphoserine phosphatase)